MVAEGPNMNLGIITNSNELVVSSHHLLLLLNLTYFKLLSTLLQHLASSCTSWGVIWHEFRVQHCSAMAACVLTSVLAFSHDNCCHAALILLTLMLAVLVTQQTVLLVQQTVL